MQLRFPQVKKVINQLLISLIIIKIINKSKNIIFIQNIFLEFHNRMKKLKILTT